MFEFCVIFFELIKEPSAWRNFKLCSFMIYSSSIYKVHLKFNHSITRKINEIFLKEKTVGIVGTTTQIRVIKKGGSLMQISCFGLILVLLLC